MPAPRALPEPPMSAQRGPHLVHDALGLGERFLVAHVEQHDETWSDREAQRRGQARRRGRTVADARAHEHIAVVAVREEQRLGLGVRRASGPPGVLGDLGALRPAGPQGVTRAGEADTERARTSNALAGRGFISDLSVMSSCSGVLARMWSLSCTAAATVTSGRVGVCTSRTSPGESCSSMP